MVDRDKADQQMDPIANGDHKDNNAYDLLLLAANLHTYIYHEVFGCLQVFMFIPNKCKFILQALFIYFRSDLTFGRKIMMIHFLKSLHM